MTTPVKPMDYAALGIKVEALEGDVREVKDSILGLDAKIEKSISSLSHEVRSAIATLSSQFAERQRTPWGVLISAAGFIVLVLGLFGGQALAPLQSDLKSIKEQIVPREEINYRAEVTNRRFRSLEKLADLLMERRYQEFRDDIRKLQEENNYLRRRSP